MYERNRDSKGRWVSGRVKRYVDEYGYERIEMDSSEFMMDDGWGVDEDEDEDIHGNHSDNILADKEEELNYEYLLIA